MNIRTNVSRFKKLDREIADGEQATEDARYEQARLAWEACVSGDVAKKDYARQVGKTPGHIRVLVTVWESQGGRPGTARRRFADAYASARSGGAETTKAEQRRRETERQVPTQHTDRVEMFQKLAADPTVRSEALDDPLTKAQVRRSVDDHQEQLAARRATARAKNQADLPSYVVRQTIRKLEEYARDLDLIADSWVYDLGDLSPATKAKLIKAASDLEASARRFANAAKKIGALRSVK